MLALGANIFSCLYLYLYVNIYHLTSNPSMCSSELKSRIFASRTANRCLISVSISAIATAYKWANQIHMNFKSRCNKKLTLQLHKHMCKVAHKTNPGKNIISIWKNYFWHYWPLLALLITSNFLPSHHCYYILRPRQQPFTGRIWPTGRTLCTTAERCLRCFMTVFDRV